MSGRYSIATLGCKVNQIDSAAICTDLESAGYGSAPFGEPAEVIIVNTCAVTARADRQGRQLVLRARAACPDALIVVTGCSPHTTQSPNAYPQADVVCGNVEKGAILSLIDQRKIKGLRIERIAPISAETTVGNAGPARMPGRTRAFCKIQDGCSFSCAYCIVPAARTCALTCKIGRAHV